jgi:hypothetical protein
VTEVGMNKPAGKKAVPLLAMCDGGRIKDKVIHDPFVAESRDGDKDCYDDNN